VFQGSVHTAKCVLSICKDLGYLPSTTLKRKQKLGIVVHAYNPSTRETEAGGWKVQGQPGLHNETLSLKKEKKIIVTSHKRLLVI
jgi:hypothetical protein